MNHSSNHHVLCLSLPDNNVLFTTNKNLLFYDPNRKAIYTDEGNLMVAIALTAKVFFNVFLLFHRQPKIISLEYLFTIILVNQFVCMNSSLPIQTINCLLKVYNFFLSNIIIL